MKKILIGVMLVLLMFVCAPTPASAVTVAELQAMIASLTAQLNAMLAQQTPVPPTQIINPTSTSTGLVSFVERPTFKIAYDKNKNESRLEGSATTYIQAGENDILLNNIYLLYKDQNGRNINTNDAGRYFYVTSGANLETIQDSNNTTLSVWRIKAGTKATIAVTATENPQMMFAGSYTLSFGDVATIDPITKNYQYGRLAYQDSKSLPVTIIGEKSPYISSSAFKGSNEVTISGVRFAKGDKVYVNNVRKGVLTDVGYSTGGAAMVGAFPISWLDKSEKGGCALYGSIQIEDPKYGKSNSIYASRGCVDDNKTQININWTNGVGKLRIGLIDDRYEKNGVVLGWISGEDNSSYGMAGWDGKYVSDLNFKTTWDVSSLSKGPYRILAVTQDSNGNICSSEKTGCNFVLSDKFKITNSILNITLPPFKSTNLTPTITITSPNGGGYYAKNSPMKVTWTTNIPQTEYLDVIRLRAYQNGQEYYLAGGVLNTGGTNVTIPSNVPAGAYTLEIKTYTKGSGVLVMDASDSYFKITDSTVTPPTQLISISPVESTINSGESVKFNFTFPRNLTGASLSIICPSGVTTGTSPEVCNRGYMNLTSNLDWNLILSNLTTQTQYVDVVYSVTYPDPTSNKGQNSTVKARVAVKPTTNTPSIKVLSPNGGEVLNVGSSAQINWASKGNIGQKIRLNLDYVTPNSGRGYLIATDIPDTGSYTWKVPNDWLGSAEQIKDYGKYYRTQACVLDSNSNISSCDYSDNTFTISSPVVTLPVIEMWGPWVVAKQSANVYIGDMVQFTSTRGDTSFSYSCGTDGMQVSSVLNPTGISQGTFYCTYTTAGPKVVSISQSGKVLVSKTIEVLPELASRNDQLNSLAAALQAIKELLKSL
jgi:hypothetical protein